MFIVTDLVSLNHFIFELFPIYIKRLYKGNPSRGETRLSVSPSKMSGIEIVRKSTAI